MLRLLDNPWPEARQLGYKRTMDRDYETRSRDGPLGPLDRSIGVLDSHGVLGN